MRDGYNRGLISIGARSRNGEDQSWQTYPFGEWCWLCGCFQDGNSIGCNGGGRHYGWLVAVSARLALSGDSVRRLEEMGYLASQSASPELTSTEGTLA
jgi:hypothetical protein